MDPTTPSLHATHSSAAHVLGWTNGTRAVTEVGSKPPAWIPLTMHTMPVLAQKNEATCVALPGSIRVQRLQNVKVAFPYAVVGNLGVYHIDLRTFVPLVGLVGYGEVLAIHAPDGTRSLFNAAPGPPSDPPHVARWISAELDNGCTVYARSGMLMPWNIGHCISIPSLFSGFYGVRIYDAMIVTAPLVQCGAVFPKT